MRLVPRLAEELKRLGALNTPGSFLVACSGGVDSGALAHMCSCLGRGIETRLVLAYVDHGLRDDTAQDIELVRALAGRLGARCVTSMVDVRAASTRNGTSLQDTARTLRYAALEELRIREGCDWILTAHHADDQAETLLLHFLTGAGVSGLRGIRSAAGRVLRPLLWSRKDMLRAYADEHAVPWREDSSNTKDVYERNALRLQVLPAIARAMKRDVTMPLARAADVFASLEQHLQAGCDAASSRCISVMADAVWLDVHALLEETEYMRSLLARAAVQRARPGVPTQADVNRVLALVPKRPGLQARLHGGLIAYRERDGIALVRDEVIPLVPHAIRAGEKLQREGRTFSSTRSSLAEIQFTDDPSVEYIDAELSGDEWTLRPWKAGDSFIPFGSRGGKKIGDYLTEIAYPLRNRPNVTVLDRGGIIIWVCGIRLDHRFRITDLTRLVTRIQYETACTLP